jgi:3-oxoacyl-[acyl-carrier protein] reductase
MRDRYLEVANARVGGAVAKRAGLPTPPRLKRYEPGEPLVEAPVLLGAAPGGRMQETVEALLRGLDIDVRTQAMGGAEKPFAALVFDATGIASTDGLRALYDFFHPVARTLGEHGRVLVLGTPPEDCAEVPRATAQRALEGFTRSFGKEVKPGNTVQLVYVREGAEAAAESTLRFLLSSKSAYVSGQVVRVDAPAPGDDGTPGDWEHPLAGKVALVTGASRGIGAAIAATLSRDGAHVIALDVPAQGEALTQTANDVGGEALQLDVTADDAPESIIEHVRERHGGVDVVAHNAGITRDKTLARMDESQWDSVMAVNLTSQVRISEALVSQGTLRPRGRIVCVSSIGGIAGNRGQTNYGASKAGVIGLVQSLAPRIAELPGTINAVAPAFIETDMTAAMPLFTREAGRRMNQMVQGGAPVDVAETIAWLASPGSAGVNGNVVRVCGQSLIGA